MADWFIGVKTAEEAKRIYRLTLLKVHPDHGGSKEETQRLIDEYTTCIVSISGPPIVDEDDGSAPWGERGWTYTTQYQYQPRQRSKEYLDMLFALTQPRFNWTVEAIGDWLWVFDTSPSDSFTLTLMGLTWSKKHQGWFWFEGVNDPNRVNHPPRREMTTEEMRDYFGSNTKKTKRYI